MTVGGVVAFGLMNWSELVALANAGSVKSCAPPPLISARDCPALPNRILALFGRIVEKPVAGIGGVAHHLRVAVADAVRPGIPGLACRIRRIDHLERVDEAVLREVRIQRDVEQSAIADVVHLVAQIDDGPGGACRQVGQRDDAWLLRHVDLSRD